MSDRFSKVTDDLRRILTIHPESHVDETLIYRKLLKDRRIRTANIHKALGAMLLLSDGSPETTAGTNLIVVGGDWEWYKKCSEAFIAICRTYSPVLQQFSIDECFIDMTGRTDTKHAVHTWHAFNGCAQIIIGSETESIGKGTVKIRLSADGCEKEISI